VGKILPHDIRTRLWDGVDLALVIYLFLPRDAMHKRGLCWHAVSVRPSVTFVNHVKTNKHIFETFLPSGSHTILVFPIPNGVAIFRWKPL